MKLSLLALVVASVSSLVLGGCSEATEGAPGGEPAAIAQEAELSSPSFPGTYRPSSSDDDQFLSEMTVERAGAKLVLHLDAFGDKHSFELQKTPSGAFVFTTGELAGDCDNPGCSFVMKYSGVVHLKKVGTRRIPSVKLTVRTMHPHPEFDGDLDGESTTTLRWTKR